MTNNIKAKRNKFLLAYITLPTLLFCSAAAQAISLSTFRIYLDSDNSTASFVMFNKTADKEKCELSLVHNNFDEGGQMLPVPSDVIPANSAEPWMRYSPKNFVVEASSPQTVRFTMRRKANTEAAEYRSYLRITCDPYEKKTESSNSDADNVAKISIKPRIIQQVPIIVRTGKLDASLSFSDISLQNETLIFHVNREGNRSVYGSLELINKSNNDVVSFKRNVSVYTDSQSVKHDLTTLGIPLEQLAIRFVEDTAYGGSINYEQDALANK
jgi:P pilus assembly chaperone PapD